MQDLTQTTLTYEQTTHGAHEITGKPWSRTVTIRQQGHVTGESPLTFVADDYDGTFTLRTDGQVMYATPNGVEYEAGVNGTVEGDD